MNQILPFLYDVCIWGLSIRMVSFANFSDGFRPDSLDPSTVLNMNRENDSVTIEATGDGESHFFKGSVTDGGEAECVLLFNPDTNRFELRPLDYAIRVTPASKDVKAPLEELEEAPPPAQPIYTKPEDTMAHWTQKFEAQDNKGSKYKSYERGSGRSYKPKHAPSIPPPKVGAPPKRIEINIPDGDADAEMGPNPSDNKDDDDDDDDDDDAELLGEIENELEMLSEDEGGMAIEIVEKSEPSKSFYKSPPKPASGTAPISLRGFISGAARRENEEDLLSSSEEE